jgi:DNA adenine methylase
METDSRPQLLIANGVHSNRGGHVSETETPVLKAPFPYPGGKAKVADLVWQRLGNVDNYVEPFMGSLATMLRRPADHFEGGYRVETANDINHFIVNFWRAVKADPAAVATWADAPVLEADLHARHRWLMQSDTATKWRERMRTDPEAFDVKIAGWWA